MSVTLQSAATLLYEHHLLREIIAGDLWTMNPADVDGSDVPFAAVTYSTKEIVPGSLLFCKGRFKPEYLDGADGNGLAAYVATSDMGAYTKAPGLIVEDASKAMALLSAAFYGYPQDEMTVIGITGTKGKTTTSYFTHAMLSAASGGKAALFSSVDNCVDGHTFVESDLTTPESLDAFRMMREAADNGMQYLVMEVSSQAYKVSRVFGLQFDAAGFLNISPDHISPIEHPTFEDYLYCKRQIVRNTNALVLGEDCEHRNLIEDDAALDGVPVTTFAEGHADASVVAMPVDESHRRFAVTAFGQHVGDVSLAIDGDFNYANAAAAVALVAAVGLTVDDSMLEALGSVRISGRMEEFHDPSSNTLAIVDYAHNYASVKALLDFVEQRFGDRHPVVTLVTGSAGNKAYDRRAEIVEAAQDRIARLILTHEDTDTESILDVCKTMLASVTNEDLDARIILNRTEALETALNDARAANDPEHLQVVLAIGKGNERWVKVENRHVPYEGDDRIVERVFAE
ncbi:UDP-N-acetylmuramoyl-L-alanyl-D-glutamate--2,6-diaminopimelate ligase [Bifidobacterium choloepi]|uniref:UDP-N-acetylmuramoyl-L-alanyl-D-glutamate--2, 6-diaminopimelate ligase n=1 Tax=Bifidobacterium choloepi TaxID=2614131 RepID=A0A6I5MZJ4_9BIFI|nr:UDP-N-acetylmuramoyl-L-alanyl-D-glutamate--2,6-diaminopimelate ligase [Bifidobacterium choloepi]NEG70078.1 UDP-N-acetylmuramoyl-L-alanyl-D-glutamate--2,6-diaminopimelate ligase [Bifidobacterium choloepi]